MSQFLEQTFSLLEWIQKLFEWFLNGCLNGCLNPLNEAESHFFDNKSNSNLYCALTVNFHYEHFTDPTNVPWVSKDETDLIPPCFFKTMAYFFL